MIDRSCTFFQRSQISSLTLSPVNHRMSLQVQEDKTSGAKRIGFLASHRSLLTAEMFFSETPAKFKNQCGVRPARIEDIDGEFDLLVGETDE